MTPTVPWTPMRRATARTRPTRTPTVTACTTAPTRLAACTAGPDAFLDPSADTDTDGDGMPDTIDGPSTSVPPLVEDEDDDGDGLDDVNETDTGCMSMRPTPYGSARSGPDNDGICDGPNAVPPICVAGPDDALGRPPKATSTRSTTRSWSR